MSLTTTLASSATLGEAQVSYFWLTGNLVSVKLFIYCNFVRVRAGWSVAENDGVWITWTGWSREIHFESHAATSLICIYFNFTSLKCHICLDIAWMLSVGSYIWFLYHVYLERDPTSHHSRGDLPSTDLRSSQCAETFLTYSHAVCTNKGTQNCAYMLFDTRC